MDVVYSHCAGLDLHKKVIVACVLTPGTGGTPHKEVRSFGTMTDELLALGDWLAQQGVTHVAMESTGVYWQPVWNLLEDRFSLLLVNPQHMKAVPGRKTDVKDSEWIAELLRRQPRRHRAGRAKDVAADRDRERSARGRFDGDARLAIRRGGDTVPQAARVCAGVGDVPRRHRLFDFRDVVVFGDYYGDPLSCLRVQRDASQLISGASVMADCAASATSRRSGM